MKKSIFIFLFLAIYCSAFAAEWKLVWSDEFDTDGLPDSTKWDYEVGYIRNNEKQYYTNKRAENARVENGNLVIEAIKEEYKNYHYTSASLHTRNTANWTYGKVEVRAKLPTGKGTWPAIWMLGANISEVGWPTCGELDIMENVGYDPSHVSFNIHTEAYNHVKGTNKGTTITVNKPWENYYVYALEWFEDRIDFYFNGGKVFTFRNEYKTYKEWPYDDPEYLILNLAIGGSWGGQQGIDDSIFPQKYYIDYVRVYQDTSAATGIKKVNEPRIGLLRNYPNPFNPETMIVFDVPRQQDIRLQVVNVAGQEVSSVLLPNMAAGEQCYPFNAAHLPGGVYFCRLQYTDGGVLVNKMVVVK